MTPVPVPPPTPPSQTVQLVKLIVGGVIALGALAAFTLLALHDKVDLATAAPLLGAVVGGGVLSGHGALKMPVDAP